MRTYLQLSQALQTRRLCSWRGLEVASSRICSSSISFFLDWAIAEGSSPLAIVGVGEGEKMRPNRNHHWHRHVRNAIRAYYETTYDSVHWHRACKNVSKSSLPTSTTLESKVPYWTSALLWFPAFMKAKAKWLHHHQSISLKQVSKFLTHFLLIWP